MSETGVFTTRHAMIGAFSPKKWQKMGLPENYGRKEADLYGQRAAIYRRCGFLQTFTCLPIEGLDPAALSNTELGAIGYHIGARAGSRNIVIDGLPSTFEPERLKYLMAPMAVTGSVCMCHIVGMTPESPDLDAALGGCKPKETLNVSPKQVRQNLELYADTGQAVDMVIFGCPHCMVREVKTLAGLLERKKIADGKRLWIGMPYQHYYLAQTMGYTEAVEAAGPAGCLPAAAWRRFRTRQFQTAFG